MLRVRLLAPIGLAILALTACGGQTNSASTTTTGEYKAAKPTAASMRSAKTAKGTAMASSANGGAVFQTNCSSCHGANGKGAPGAFPPLAGNPTVTGDASKVIHIVKDGLNGAVTINGQSYNGTMPSWKGKLSNNDIAAVITFIRSSWGNKAGAVTAAQVASTP